MAKLRRWNRWALLGLVLAVPGCAGMDFDFRGIGQGAAVDARQASAQRPPADDRGVISYPSYQVALARRGDTVADVAARVGLPADELARFNGLPRDVRLREGELLALPRRVAEPSPQTGADFTGPIRPREEVDIASLAGNAIERADPGGDGRGGRATAAAVGPEPVRHRVARGETAFSIARLYNVSVRGLADWNGLGPDFAVREGQYLLIPVPETTTVERIDPVTAPGQGSPTPTPPSASQPLPEPPEEVEARVEEATPPSPELSQTRTAASSARFVLPVQGPIIRDYSPSTDGIDIAASAGAPVKAAGDGTVAAITRDTNQVPILVIRHEGNLLTVYAGVDDIAVKKGDAVRRGQTVAKVRDASPAVLHFEVREGFDSVDPAPYLE